MSEQELREEYAKVCEEQKRLRSQLLELNIKKMSLACSITSSVFGGRFGQSKPTAEEWKAATVEKAAKYAKLARAANG